VALKLSRLALSLLWKRKFFFDREWQELCLCIIEEENDPVNKENQIQKPYTARLI
jgi:hypothetical protein